MLVQSESLYLVMFVSTYSNDLNNNLRTSIIINPVSDIICLTQHQPDFKRFSILRFDKKIPIHLKTHCQIASAPTF